MHNVPLSQRTYAHRVRLRGSINARGFLFLSGWCVLWKRRERNPFVFLVLVDDARTTGGRREDSPRPGPRWELVTTLSPGWFIRRRGDRVSGTCTRSFMINNAAWNEKRGSRRVRCPWAGKEKVRRTWQGDFWKNGVEVYGRRWRGSRGW